MYELAANLDGPFAVGHCEYDSWEGSLQARVLDKASLAEASLVQDVSGLFPDVLKNMQTEDLEQKKLVSV